MTVTNIDSPEAMFDGIMQAAVCQEVVGWRENTRRLMLVLSDNTYHMAGDGKVGQSCSLITCANLPILSTLSFFAKRSAVAFRTDNPLLITVYNICGKKWSS